MSNKAEPNVTITLLDFASGDHQIQTEHSTWTGNTTETERRILSMPDDTTVRLVRAYSHGHQDTTVSKLRQMEYGWWGW